MGWSDYVNESNVACASRGKAKCLALAYNERAKFSGLSAMSENGLLTDSQLSYIIPFFGRIVGNSYVPYTTTSIYEEMGEDRIYFQDKFNPKCSRLWFEQAIRVINKLNASSINFSVALAGSVQKSIFIADFYNYWIGDTPQEAVDRELGNLEVISEYSGTIIHYTSAWYLVPVFGLDKYGGDCASTNSTVRIKIGNVFLYDKSINLKVILSAKKTYPTGIFNAGTSGFTEGDNVIFSDIAFDIDESGYFNLPQIPGEELSNFPKYPTTNNPTCGYTASISKIIYPGGFEFVAGS